MGYTESSIRSNRLPGGFSDPFVGLYGAVTKGNFPDGQVRWDFYQGKLNDPTNILTNQRLDARSLSLTGNVGYQFPLDDGWFVEPSAGAVYSEVKVDTLQTGGAIFVLSNPSFALPTASRSATSTASSAARACESARTSSPTASRCSPSSPPA